MNAGYQTVKSRILVAVISVLMVFGNVVSPLAGAFDVYAAGNASVATWDQLIDAIDSKADNIDVTADIFADSTITVDYPVTITSSAGKTIYQKERQNYDTMFVVAENGELELGAGLTLSGKTTKCANGTLMSEDNIEFVPGKQAGFTMSEGGNFFGVSSNRFKRIGTEPETPYVFTLSEFGELLYEGQPISSNNDAYVHPATSSNTIIVYKSNEDNPATEIVDGEEYVIWNTNPSSSGWLQSNGFLWKTVGSRADATKWTVYGSDSSEADKYTFNGEDYPNRDAALAALREYNAEQQRCEDGRDCASYTNSNFGSGTAENPKGFFVEVYSGGTATLNGASLKEFATDTPNTTLEWVAPVVANGTDAVFNITGGKITHNNVAYNITNNKSANDAYSLKGEIEKLDRTNSAGAVIYNAGAQGKISGGTIEKNRADTGAISILGEGTSVEMTGGDIQKNVGIHFGGAAYVYDGGSLIMSGGTMNNNFAWNMGGAVYVSDEVYGSTKWMDPDSTEKVGLSHFTLDGGKLNENFAVNRGGAIYVESDGVALLSGEINRNDCRSLGGAIYVAGDGIQRMYRLFIKNGCITGNKAVTANTRLNHYLAGESDGMCNIQNNENDDKNLAGDNHDYYGYAGYGGGLWLCAFGGNATFGNAKDAQVVIDDNTAATKGNDIKLRPTRPGEGSSINIVGDADVIAKNWVNEDTGAVIEDNQIYTGPLPITNKRDKQGCDSSLMITDNMARVGGAIAANGTVIFGPAKNVYRIHTRLDVTKGWNNTEGIDKPDVKLSLYFQDKDGKYPLKGYSHVLDGEKDSVGENTTIWEAEPWQLAVALPLTYEKEVGNNTEILPVFTFEDPENAGRILNPSTHDDLERIYNLFDAGKLSAGDGKVQVNLVVEETIDGDSPSAHNYTYKAEQIKLKDVVLTEGPEQKYYDKGGNVTATMRTNVIELGFDQNVENTYEKQEPEIMKFVNEAVHKDIKLDEEFTYDVIAKVTNDAESVVITDTLEPYLDFATNANQIYVQDVGPEVDYKVTYDIAGTKKNENTTVSQLTTNNHTANNLGFDVVGLGDNAKKRFVDATVDGKNTKKLVVEIPDAKPYRGHWIKVRFTAKIKEGVTLDDLKAAGVYRTISGSAENDYDNPRNEPNTGNKPVIASANHTGVPNKAEYTISARNDAKYSDTSNTVTVKPREIELTASKLWLNKQGNSTSWPRGAKVTFALWKVADDKEEYLEEGALSVGGYRLVFTGYPELENGRYEIRESVSGTLSSLVDVKRTEDEQSGNISYVFTNKLTDKPVYPATLKINADKSIVGRVLKDKEFSFELKDESGNTWTAKNNASGQIVFNDIIYNSETVKDSELVNGKKTFTYTLKELKENLDNIEYDTTVKTIKVEVEKVDNGSSISYVINSVTDNEGNSYNPTYTYDNTNSANAPRVNGRAGAGYLSSVNIKPIYTDQGLRKKYAYSVHDMNQNTVYDVAFCLDANKYFTTNEKFTYAQENLQAVVGDDETIKKLKKIFYYGYLKHPDVAGYDSNDFRLATQLAVWSLLSPGSWDVEENKKATNNKMIWDLAENYILNQDDLPNGIDVNIFVYKSSADPEEDQPLAIPTLAIRPMNVAVATGSFNNVVTTDIKGKKHWDDSNNQDRKRPQSIEVTLKADGVDKETITVTGPDWAYEFKDYPKYKADGEEIVYTVVETVPEDYSVEYVDNTYDIKNSYTPEDTSISVTKAWEDANNQDGIRPDSVEVTLKADGVDKETVKLSADNNWTHTFNNLPKKADGKDIVYTVEEVKTAVITGTDGASTYAIAVSGSAAEGFTVTNTHTPEIVELSVKKAWNDANNQDGIRPESVEVKLLANGEAKETVELNADNEWKHTFTDLPKKSGGKDITYTVEEVKAGVITGEDGNGTYAIAVSGSASEGFTVTNTHTPEKTVVEGEKNWEDADNQDGIRPSEIKITLKADGEVKATKTVTAADGWKWSFEGLDKYRSGKVKEEVVYTIEEEAVSGYETTISGYNVSNTHQPKTITINGTKHWDDSNNQDRKRPQSIEVTLKADGVDKETTTVTGPDWTYEFKDLPKYRAEGVEVVYTVVEEVPEGYSVEYIENTHDIKNSYTPEETSISVTKAWNDVNNQDGIRPDSVEVTLKADGASKETVKLSADNNWTHTFNNLPKKADGKDIVYTVEEDKTDVITGTDGEGTYAITVSGSATEGFTVTNTHTPEKVDVEGKKTWVDANESGRPSSITITLLADGVPVEGKTITVTAADGWKWSFTNLPKKANGNDITYTVAEEKVEHYAAVVDAMDVENTNPTPEKYVNNDVNWDFENFDQVFEYEIMAYVTKDGKKLTITDTLVDVLEFVGDGNIKVYDMGEGYEANNHKTSVEGEGVGTITPTSAVAEGQDLEVKIDDATALQNHWIKVTFDAQIKASAYEKVKALIADRNKDDPQWSEVKDNGFVLIKKEHDGVPNKATYTLETENNGKFEEETNTVTIEPETSNLKVKKTWSFLDYIPGVDTWPEGTSVTFGLFKDGEPLMGSIGANGVFTLPEEGATDAEQATVTLTADKHDPVLVTGLPKLDGVKYTAREIELTSPQGTFAADAATGNLVSNAIDYIKYIVTMIFNSGEETEDGVDEFVAENDIETTIKISKTDLGGNELEGAEMKVFAGTDTSENGVLVDDENGTDGKAAWTSDGNAHELTLKPGTYTMVEVVAPDDYACVTTEMTFKVNEDGSIELVTTTVNNGGEITVQNGNNVVLADAPYRYISKTDLGGTPLAGAEMTLVLPEGHPEATEENEGKLSWTSEATAKKFIATPGVYTLVENTAPLGYQCITEVKFKVDENGKITVTKAEETTYGNETVDLTGVSEDGKTFILKDAPAEPETEKYVNKDVDATLETFDEPFDYDIMAYVTSDGVSLTITDTLVDVLEFVPDEAIKVFDMGTKNDHQTTVAEAGDDITSDAQIATDKQTLTVEIDKLDEKGLQGHWIKVSFKAQIKESAYEDVKKLIAERNDKDPQWADIAADGNKPVEIEKKHDGVPNKAEYTIKVANGYDYELETNTVTVEPDTEKITVSKTWKVGTSTAWPEGTVVTFGIFKKTDGVVAEKPYMTVDLDAENTTKIVTGLPKIDGVEYVAREIKVTKGEVSADVTYDAEGVGTAITDAIKYVAQIAEDAVNGTYAAENTVSYKVKISKTDLGGTELEGAEMEIYEGEKAEGEPVDTWTSSADKPHEVYLEPGKYTIKEDTAPIGYQVITEVTFTVDEDGNVTVDEVRGDVEQLEDGTIVLKDAPVGPEIEKYVNKQKDDLEDEERDETVHTDLSAFDEVYTYDIQAYITADATYVEVTDQLNEVLEFVGNEPEAVVVKDGQGKGKTTAPKLTSTEGQEEVEYSFDKDGWKEGKLVLTVGDKSEKAPKLYPNGKWLQITFNAKIKDAYKSIEAIKEVDGVWVNIKENDPIDDADVVEEFSGAKEDAHEGIENDSSYRVRSVVAELNVNNEFAYNDASNTVTVQPPTTEVSFSKTDLGGNELEGARIKVTAEDGTVVDEWSSTKKDHVLNLADGKYTMTEKLAPAGYAEVTTDMVFEVKDGKVTLLTASVDNGGEFIKAEGEDAHLILKDAPYRYISKTDLGGTELDDAKMTLVLPQGHPQATEENEGKLNWTSKAGEPYKFIAVDGDYVLKETVAPDGYEVATEIEFSVDKDGKVTVKKVTETYGENEDIVVCEVDKDDATKIVLKDAPTPPETEKYVNKDVDATLKTFNKPFDYDVMAYVTVDGVSLTITDTLVDVLEFVPGADINVFDMGTENDHKTTVAETGKDITSDAQIAAVDQTLKVEIDKLDEKGLQGHWIKVSFKAQIKESAYEAVKDLIAERNDKDPQWSEIAADDNGRVKIFKDHDGVPNKAEYSLETTNGGNFEEKTNTVTVEPETDKITVNKSWKVGTSTAWPEGTVVTFGIFKKTDGAVAEKPYMTVDLDKENPSKTVKGLPKIDGVEYVAREIKVTKGEVSADVAYDAEGVGTAITDAIKYVVQIAEDAVNSSYTATNTVSYKVKISKTDLGGTELEGAEMKIVDEDGNVVEDGEWTSSADKPHEIYLEPGTYTMTEEVAPEGYAQVTTDMTFTVNEDGTVTLDTVEVDNGGEFKKAEGEDAYLLLADAPYRYISKTDLGGTELEGAEMSLTKPDGTVQTWTSGTEAEQFIATVGEYTLVETVAPDGYQCVTTEMKFSVDGSGKVTLDEVLVTNGVDADGEISISEDGKTIVLADAPAKPVIEKYVNKETEDLEAEVRDGTVHTDLSAFDEVYTYDIQAYITADATYVEVEDELKSVLEFAGEKPVRVVVKDGQGQGKATAPALTSTEGQEEVEYSFDKDAWKAGKLVLTVGEDSEDAPKLYPNGKWLQITFNAKIKDAYKSIEALKAAGADVWTIITENEEIDDADVVDEFSGAKVDSHDGIINTSNYKIKSIVAGLNVDNGFAYKVKSNTVTVQPESTEVSFTKKALGGDELEGAEIKLTDADGNVIDEWTSSKEDHVLHLADGEYVMTEVVAPVGYYRVTTKMRFEVKDGKVKLLTAEVDNDGVLTLEGNNIILEDCPIVMSEYEPEKPETKTEETTVPDKVLSKKETKVKAANTGDNNLIVIWTMTLIVTICAIVLGAIKRRRENR